MRASRRLTLRLFLKGYLLVGLVVIAVVIGWFSFRLTRELERQAQLTTSLIARVTGPVLFSETPDRGNQEQLRRVIEEVDFPFVFTDVAGRPILWNPEQLGIPLPESLADLLHSDPEHPTDPDLRRVLLRVAAFDAEHPPIPLEGPGESGVILGRLHYGNSSLMTRIQWMPWLEAALIVAFMGVVLLAFRQMKRSEQRNIWVGMAKETAHQMGTPLTSLTGWLALLRDEDALRSAETSGETDRDQVLTEVQHDVDRLSRVSSRFSQIGSQPKFVETRVDELVERACDYFRTRLPHLGKQVVIESRIEAVAAVPASPQLLDWAVENLLKNALDAIDKQQGRIVAECRRTEAGIIEILVSDNGKGMAPGVQERVFDPGFSTKQRGWGMGLALVRRIVVEYHHGRIEVLRSVEGEGTTFRIQLPAA